MAAEDIRDVEETILVLVLFIDAAHQSRSGRQHLVDEDEDRFLWRQFDTLADDVNKLSNGKVGRHEVFLLIDGRNIRLLNLLADDLWDRSMMSVHQNKR